MTSKRQFIEQMAKHLPPSASDLRLLDINGEAGALLAELRHDLDVRAASGVMVKTAQPWNAPSQSMDAVVAYGYVVNAAFLACALDVLRPGGRLIVVNTRGQVTEALGQTLESAGYVRILVERAGDAGVLLRGEKAHTIADTLDRIQQVAQADADMLDLTRYQGRYVHLLIVQTPNKPVWRLAEDEAVTWQAVALDHGEAQPWLLAFSSLPKAVSFMQPAVLAGKIRDVNKVGKFSKATAADWTQPVLLNPTLDVLEGKTVCFVPVDPDTAEAPDE